MIVVTGAAGFIGSSLIASLNEKNFKDLILVDDFSNPIKNKNLSNKQYREQVHRNQFFDWLRINQESVQIIIHLGARTDTTEFRVPIFDELNLNYSKEVWKLSVEFGIPLIYASSAATYGDGALGYADNHELPFQLKPLNPYGESKNDFDRWALSQKDQPYFWAGLKFFNVYGPNEYHKNRMASVVLHAYRQIRETGGMKLFRSHRPDYADGGQLRDFVYVKDVVDVIHFLAANRKHSGLYNLGTGKAESFYQLASECFRAMQLPEKIEYIDTPADIRDKYQYYTCAEMDKLRSIGYTKPFRDLAAGIDDYMTQYLIPNRYF